jgi:hypothetical protein
MKRIIELSASDLQNMLSDNYVHFRGFHLALSVDAKDFIRYHYESP